MTPDTAVFIACCTFGGGMAGLEVARQLVARKARLLDRQRERAQAARETLPAIATAALWEEANAARRKARQEWEAARERRDTRDEGRAAHDARVATTRALRLELGR